VKITIESNALLDVDWRPEIAELLQLAKSCPMIDVHRTAGALRERSRPAGDPDATERRRQLLTVPALTEAFILGVSELDGPESHLTEGDENAALNAISLALWSRPIATMRETSSDLEDVVHLHTPPPRAGSIRLDRSADARATTRARAAWHPRPLARGGTKRGSGRVRQPVTRPRSARTDWPRKRDRGSGAGAEAMTG
jgi:hypothetical protein